MGLRPRARQTKNETDNGNFLPIVLSRLWCKIPFRELTKAGFVRPFGTLFGSHLSWGKERCERETKIGDWSNLCSPPNIGYINNLFFGLFAPLFVANTANEKADLFGPAFHKICSGQNGPSTMETATSG
jgi:hypothetical protein